MNAHDFSPRLGMPYLLPQQAQKHVTVNDGLTTLDTLVMASVREVEREVPPETPMPGDSYIVGENPTGAWSGHAREMTIWADEVWTFYAPQEGWRVWDEDAAALRVFANGAWQPVLTRTPVFDALSIGAEIGPNIPLTVRGNTTLMTAIPAAENGSGDFRLVLNREAHDSTSTVLFQTGFDAGAELGLIGDDTFCVKVTPDGQNWTTALKVDPETGFLGVAGDPRANLAITAYGSIQARSDEGYFLMRANGSLEVARHSGGPTYIRSRSDGSELQIGVTSSAGALNADTIRIRPDDEDILFDYPLLPLNDGAIPLGNASRRFSDIYLMNAPTVLSDARVKKDVAALRRPLDFVQALNPVSFRYEDSSELHFGFLAQEVRDALHANAYGDAALWVGGDKDEDKGPQGLRLEELIAVLTAAMQELVQRMTALEAQHRDAL